MLKKYYLHVNYEPLTGFHILNLTHNLYTDLRYNCLFHHSQSYSAFMEVIKFLNLHNKLNNEKSLIIVPNNWTEKDYFEFIDVVYDFHVCKYIHIN